MSTTLTHKNSQGDTDHHLRLVIGHIFQHESQFRRSIDNIDNQWVHSRSVNHKNTQCCRAPGGLGTPEKIGIGFEAVVSNSAPAPEQAEDAAGVKGDGAAELATSAFPVLGELQTENKTHPETLRSELAGSSPTSPHSSRLPGVSDYGIYPMSYPQQGYPASYPQPDYPTSASPHGSPCGPRREGATNDNNMALWSYQIRKIMLVVALPRQQHEITSRLPPTRREPCAPLKSDRFL
ncbi:hypothetical protein QBC36DRAFT_313231 [Triangularia setosa]|uniref:Uncharacterized protein n=1 Tax=Triangularia setosa TaxID=2587417 RepID=A0AAN6W2D4_9PEZI|nr:hypothetical protein QBC36DRAFT_313231 [Podospora setosa]